MSAARFFRVPATPVFPVDPADSHAKARLRHALAILNRVSGRLDP